MERERFTKITQIAGEYTAYFYVFSIFLSSKLNMKAGYLLLFFALLQLVLHPEKIQKIDKKIYLSFLLLFVLGIFWNYMGSPGGGIRAFVRQGGQFIYGIALLLLLHESKRNAWSATIALGTNVLSYFFLWRPLDYFVFFQDLGRIRIMLVLGFSYILFWLLEKCFEDWKQCYLLVLLYLPVRALLVSNSRMAFISVFIVLIFYLVWKAFQNKKHIKGIVVLLLSLSLLSSSLPPSYVEHMKTSLNTRDNMSNLYRVSMWKAGIQILKEHPLWGVGNEEEHIYPLIQKYVAEHEESEQIRNGFLLGNEFAHLHNMYLDFFVENGSLAILFLVQLFVFIPGAFWKRRNSSESLANFAAILCFYVYGMTWSLYYGFGLAQTMFQILLAGMLLF